MRALILSDSHGRRDLVVQAFTQANQVEPVDLVLFAGDGWDDLMPLVDKKMTIYAVRGNVESVPSGPPYLRVETLGQVRTLIVHGHRLGVKNTLDDLAANAREKEATIAVYGHTHVPRIKWHRGVLTINPGALRDGRYAVLTILCSGRIEPELMHLAGNEPLGSRV